MSLSSVPTALLVPPVNCLLAACVGALFLRRRFGRVLLAIGLAGLVLFAVPYVAETMLVALEQNIGAGKGDPPGAIVILSGDEAETLENALPGTPFAYVVGSLTLERERAGAALAKRIGLPVLVTGGSIHKGAPPLATMMAASLHDDFGVSARWSETASLDTWENALKSAAILHDEGITSVFVVTHAWHMRRALIAFRRAGLRVVAAPVALDAPPPLDLEHLVPRARSWLTSYYALHEWIGCAWYALKS